MADEIAKQIVAQGNEVRQVKVKMKAGEADKAAVDAAVKELLALKAKYKEVAGTDFAPPGQAPIGFLGIIFLLFGLRVWRDTRTFSASERGEGPRKTKIKRCQQLS